MLEAAAGRVPAGAASIRPEVPTAAIRGPGRDPRSVGCHRQCRAQRQVGAASSVKLQRGCAVNKPPPTTLKAAAGRVPAGAAPALYVSLAAAGHVPAGAARSRTKWCVARTRCSASLEELEEGALAAG